MSILISSFIPPPCGSIARLVGLAKYIITAPRLPGLRCASPAPFQDGERSPQPVACRAPNPSMLLKGASLEERPELRFRVEADGHPALAVRDRDGELPALIAIAAPLLDHGPRPAWMSSIVP